MDDEAALAEQIAFLRRYGAAQKGHSDDTLLDHLLGVRALLVSWGAAPAVCCAGLFHSVYGTAGFAEVSVPLILRPVVQRLIGEEAEALVHLFCRADAAELLAAARRDADRRDAGEDPEPATRTIGDRLSGAPIPLTAGRAEDWVNLAIANVAEQAPRLPPDYLEFERERLRPLLALALPGARAALA